MDGLAFVQVILGDGAIRYLLHIGNLQSIHAGVEVLVVGGEKECGARSKQADHRFQEPGVIHGDVEGYVASFGGGVGGRVNHGQIEALFFSSGIFQKIEGMGLDQDVGVWIDAVEGHVLPGPLDDVFRPVHGNGGACPPLAA